MLGLKGSCDTRGKNLIILADKVRVLFDLQKPDRT